MSVTSSLRSRLSSLKTHSVKRVASIGDPKRWRYLQRRRGTVAGGKPNTTAVIAASAAVCIVLFMTIISTLIAAGSVHEAAKNYRNTAESSTTVTSTQYLTTPVASSTESASTPSPTETSSGSIPATTSTTILIPTTTHESSTTGFTETTTISNMTTIPTTNASESSLTTTPFNITSLPTTITTTPNHSTTFNSSMSLPTSTTAVTTVSTNATTATITITDITTVNRTIEPTTAENMTTTVEPTSTSIIGSASTSTMSTTQPAVNETTTEITSAPNATTTINLTSTKCGTTSSTNATTRIATTLETLTPSMPSTTSNISTTATTQSSSAAIISTSSESANTSASTTVSTTEATSETYITPEITTIISTTLSRSGNATSSSSSTTTAKATTTTTSRTPSIITTTPRTITSATTTFPTTPAGISEETSPTTSSPEATTTTTLTTKTTTTTTVVSNTALTSALTSSAATNSTFQPTTQSTTSTTQPATTATTTPSASAGDLEAANFFLMNMNRSVDVCSNFYQFACGGVNATGPGYDSVLSRITAGTMESLKNAIGNISVADTADTMSMTKKCDVKRAEEHADSKLFSSSKYTDRETGRDNVSRLTSSEISSSIRQCSEGRSQPNSVPTAFEKLKYAYDACMNWKTANQSSLTLINYSIRGLSSTGQWPVRRSSLSPDRLASKLARLDAQYDAEPIISAEVLPAFDNPALQTLVLSPGNLLIPPRCLTDPTGCSFEGNDTVNVTTLYLETVETSITTLNDMATENAIAPIDVSSYATEIVQFEIELAKIFPTYLVWSGPYRNYSEQDNILTVHALKSNYSFTHSFLSQLLPFVSEHLLKPYATVRVSSLEYLKRLESLISKTSPTTVENYILWRLVYKLGVNFFEPTLRLKLQQLEIGQPSVYYNRNPNSLPAPVHECFDLADKFLFNISARVLADSWSLSKAGANSEAFGIVAEISTNISQAMSAHIANASWLDAVSRTNLQAKVDGLSFAVGYPDWLNNDTSLDTFYADLNINKGVVFTNVILELYTWNAVRRFEPMYRLRGQRNHFTGSLIDIGVTLDLHSNTVTIPIGALQAPLFAADWPLPVTYGMIGSLIANAISHATDSEGVQFNANGKCTSGILTSNSEQNLERTDRCLINQFNDFAIADTNLTINGTQTMLSNFASLVGLQIAAAAYSLIGEQPYLLPELEEYSNEQLFYLSWASARCETNPDELNARETGEQVEFSRRSSVEALFEGMWADKYILRDSFKCPPSNTSQICIV